MKGQWIGRSRGGRALARTLALQLLGGRQLRLNTGLLSQAGHGRQAYMHRIGWMGAAHGWENVRAGVTRSKLGHLGGTVGALVRGRRLEALGSGNQRGVEEGWRVWAGEARRQGQVGAASSGLLRVLGPAAIAWIQCGSLGCCERQCDLGLQRTRCAVSEPGRHAEQHSIRALRPQRRGRGSCPPAAWGLTAARTLPRLPACSVGGGMEQGR